MTIAVLLVPLVAMQFSDEVTWSVFDFAFAAVLLGGTGFLLIATVALTVRAAERSA